MNGLVASILLPIKITGVGKTLLSLARIAGTLDLASIPNRTRLFGTATYLRKATTLFRTTITLVKQTHHNGLSK